jgi:hypothetical protein
MEQTMPHLDLRPELGRALTGLHAIAERTRALAVHLRDCWPVRVPARPLSELRSGGLWLPPGPAQPVAGPPTNATFRDLCQHLVNLKALIFPFRTAADSPAELAWLRSREPGYAAAGVADALGRIELVCDRLIDQLDLRDAFPSVDCHAEALLTPVPNALELWHPPDGRPLPEIDPQDIATLAWAAGKLDEARGEGATGLGQGTGTSREGTPDPGRTPLAGQAQGDASRASGGRGVSGSRTRKANITPG